jgi:hypothetical protein
MKIEEHLEGVADAQCRSVLAKLLSAYLSPAFGSLPKREIDLLFYGALEDLGYVNSDPSIYSIVKSLRVTRAKARNLLYDIELRRLNTDVLDERVRGALKQPLIQKQGDTFVLEIENPLELDHLRSIVQSLGHASDGSFSPSLVRLSSGAFAALMEHFIDKSERDVLQRALVKAGAPDTSLAGIFKGVLKKVASKVAADAGEAALEQVGEYLTPFVDGAVDKAVEIATSLFSKDSEDTA